MTRLKIDTEQSDSMVKAMPVGIVGFELCGAEGNYGTFR